MTRLRPQDLTEPAWVSVRSAWEPVLGLGLLWVQLLAPRLLYGPPRPPSPPPVQLRPVQHGPALTPAEEAA